MVDILHAKYRAAIRGPPRDSADGTHNSQER